MVTIMLGVIVVLGGVAILFDLGGIATGFARFGVSVEQRADPHARRLPILRRMIARRQAAPERHLRRQVVIARLSGLMFVALGIGAIATGR